MPETPENRVLLNALRRLDWSPEGLARRVNTLAISSGLNRRIHEKTPYKWLRGDCPRSPIAELAVHVLNEALPEPLGAQELGWTTSAQSAFLPADAGLGDGRSQIGAVLDDLAWRDLMNRREFARLSGAALIGAAVPTGAVEFGRAERMTAGDRVTAQVMDALDDLSSTLRRSDDLGGRLAYEWAVRECTWVAQLMRHGTYDDAIAARLHSTLANFAQIAGWSAFDLGHHGLGQRLHLLALRAARSGADHDLPSHILAMMTVQSWWRGGHRDALALSDAAMTGIGPDTNPRVLAWIHSNRAQVCGANGLRTETLAAIDDARQSLAEPADQDPSWIYWVGDATLHSDAGKAYEGLGRSDLAVAAYEDAIVHLDEYPREQVINMCYLARAQVTDRRIAEAAGTVRTILEHGSGLESGRWKEMVRETCVQLAPHRAVSEVRDALAAARECLQN
ncbi:MAG TPA: hypothetical protein VGM10_27475 [Actinocrinis sp.]